MSGDRFDFELDHEAGFGPVTAQSGVLVLLEHFRSGGVASIVDQDISFKRRKRGLSEFASPLWLGAARNSDQLRLERGFRRHRAAEEGSGHEPSVSHHTDG